MFNQCIHLGRGKTDSSYQITFSVPSDWSGRIWARRNCDFSVNPGPNSCLDGGCNGGLTCPSLEVQFYSYFTYAYAYDDLTPLFTYSASSNAGYTATFCPAS
ncbi:Thaumatin-like protein [Mycena venus]|uniref:Thaumatin-like protein n=1 Tax=Mycena venus TaxID=2733690 RepID=A0A8H7CLV8_9AGAR|nr:Thaumatin-like protein [Mycena venus]